MPGVERRIHTPEEFEMAAALRDVLAGEQITRYVGEWGVAFEQTLLYLSHFPDRADVPTMEYSFVMKTTDAGEVEARNFHREANEKGKGNGSASLQFLERSFALATDTSMLITFDVSIDQSDTRRWLLKNGYAPEPVTKRRERFMKRLQPANK